MAAEYKRKWEVRRGGRSVSDESRTNYYNIPVVHKAHWKWLVIVYFFLGGIASASYVIATVAEIWGGVDGRRITRAGRYLSLAALLPCPVLLILDLGRPERFYRMLRVLKLRSPMSVGTWGLTIFAGFSGLSALIAAAQDGLLRRASLMTRILLALPSKPLSLLGSVFGFFVGGYTGVLLAATAIPLWAKNYLLMGPLFLASAMSNASAAITLVLVLARGTSARTLNRLERLDQFALISELALLLTARTNLGPTIGRPLREGHLGRVYRWGILGAGITAPLALLSAAGALHNGRAIRLLAATSSLLSLTGGLLLRYLFIMAGHASADDPQASFEWTRHGSSSPARLTPREHD